MTSRTMRSVTIPRNSPDTSRATIRRELDLGLSNAKMKTFESKKALLGILGLPDVLPQLGKPYGAPGSGIDGHPDISGTEQAEVCPVFHQRSPNRLRLRGEQARSHEPIQELGFRTAELERERRFHSNTIVFPW